MSAAFSDSGQATIEDRLSHALDDLTVSAPTRNGNSHSFEDLPMELLIEIVDFLRRPADIAACCLASHKMLDIARPRLYRDVRFILLGGQKTPGQQGTGTKSEPDLALVQSIPHSDIGRLIFTIDISVNRASSCRTQTANPPTDGTSAELATCSCEDLDGLMRAAFMQMSSLRSLEMICRLCDIRSNEHRHGYFVDGTLPTPGLDSLSISCTCTKRSDKYIADLLSTPLFKTVSQLSLGIQRLPPDSSSEGNPLEDALRTKDPEKAILQNIKTLGLHSHPSNLTILRHRPVERLGIPLRVFGLNVEQNFHFDLVSSPTAKAGSLTVFLTDRIMTWGALIKTCPEPYRNLRDVGVLRFESTPTEADFEKISFISVLKRLHIIRVNRKGLRSPNSRVIDIDDAFVAKVGTYSHSLRFIRVGNRPAAVGDPPPMLWERQISREVSNEQKGAEGEGDGKDDVWVAHILRARIHTYWDVLRGKDEL